MQSKLLLTIKRRLQSYKPYIIASEIKHVLKKHFKKLDDPHRSIISLEPDDPSRGNVLLCNVIDPFLLKPGQPVSCAHTHDWESLQIAKTFLEFGYCVDVISYKNNTFTPQKDYSFFIDSRWNLERLAPLLNSDCVKVMHIDTAHILFHNAAEARRLVELQQRRGVTLLPRRFEMPNKAIEMADCATALGNEFTISTYRYAKKPIYRIPISTPVLYAFPDDKDFESCRKRFLWLGSGGMVHKGLDLVLDAFAQLPEYHLTICGPVQDEQDFEQAFYKELYQSPNVHTVGWVDIDSPEFIAIANSCIGLIYPSCSEGGGGSVVTCMHAGLIPIVSYESSVDVEDDFGLILRTCSVEEIKGAIRKVSDLPTQELKQRARGTWQFVRTNHTRERFALEYRNVMAKVIATVYHKSKLGTGIVAEDTLATETNDSTGLGVNVACTIRNAL